MSNRPLTKTEWLTSLEKLWESAQQPQKWVGLTHEEILEQIVLSGFNPEWKIEIGMAFSVACNLENKLKEKNT